MSEQSSKKARADKLRTLTGTVVSDKMDQDGRGRHAERLIKHPVYGKYIRRTTKVLVHDQDNASKLGDIVSITECRPISKRKSWRLVEVLESAEAQ